MPTTNPNAPDADLIAAALRLAAEHARVIMLEEISTTATEEELGAALERRFEAAHAVVDAPTAVTIDGAAATARSLAVMCEALEGVEWENSPVSALISHLAADVENLRGTPAA
jgi:hypothetical protein